MDDDSARKLMATTGKTIASFEIKTSDIFSDSIRIHFTDGTDIELYGFTGGERDPGVIEVA